MTRAELAMKALARCIAVIQPKGCQGKRWVVITQGPWPGKLDDDGTVLGIRAVQCGDVHEDAAWLRAWEPDGTPHMHHEFMEEPS